MGGASRFRRPARTAQTANRALEPLGVFLARCLAPTLVVAAVLFAALSFASAPGTRRCVSRRDDRRARTRHSPDPPRTRGPGHRLRDPGVRRAARRRPKSLPQLLAVRSPCRGARDLPGRPDDREPDHPRDWGALLDQRRDSFRNSGRQPLLHQSPRRSLRRGSRARRGPAISS